MRWEATTLEKLTTLLSLIILSVQVMFALYSLLTLSWYRIYAKASSGKLDARKHHRDISLVIVANILVAAGASVLFLSVVFVSSVEERERWAIAGSMVMGIIRFGRTRTSLLSLCCCVSTLLCFPASGCAFGWIVSCSWEFGLLLRSVLVGVKFVVTGSLLLRELKRLASKRTGKITSSVSARLFYLTLTFTFAWVLGGVIW